MFRFARACEAIAATTRTSEKVKTLADYFRTAGVESASLAAVFACGRPFPVCDERTLNVGWSLLGKVIAGIAGVSSEDLAGVYRQHGDTGAMAAALWDSRPGEGFKLAAVADGFAQLAVARGPTQKQPLLAKLLGGSSAIEAKYLVKIMSSDLRIGLKEGLVEKAIAVAFGAPPGDVQRANLLTGDSGETLRMAAAGRLGEAALRLFHPIGFMLASPLQNAEEAFSGTESWLVEDKYDGIRAHVHGDGSRVRIFSRTLDDITHQFPELPPLFLKLPGKFLMDGEVLAWNAEEGRARPFGEIQKRLGRKNPSPELLDEVPVGFVAFDLLFHAGPGEAGEALFDTPLVERRSRLENLLSGAGASLRASQLRRVATPEQLSVEFDRALERGNEGLMLKDANSAYTAGRRGQSWKKLKKELALLDVVVTAVEYGHGKRHAVLSDYTFAVRGPDGELRDIGKAYTGLTDAEISRLTAFFLDHVIEDRGFRLVVEPLVVLEIAFNGIQTSDRHSSGLALRFPRIKKIRDDKPVSEIDTLETANRLAVKVNR